MSTAAYKEGGSSVQDTSTPPEILRQFKRKGLHSVCVFQHHGQRPSSPPRGHLLLRIPVARPGRRLVAGGALVGFPPEKPAGERPGERSLREDMGGAFENDCLKLLRMMSR